MPSRTKGDPFLGGIPVHLTKRLSRIAERHRGQKPLNNLVYITCVKLPNERRA
jgi:hypothetical protein